jgi:hypothetical protein
MQFAKIYGFTDLDGLAMRRSTMGSVVEPQGAEALR